MTSIFARQYAPFELPSTIRFWPITDTGEFLESTRNFSRVQRDRRRVGSHGAEVRQTGQIGNRDCRRFP
jgi:hypothetical protein